MSLYQIPDYWSPQEALAIYEFLTEIQQLIWDRYQLPIIDAFRADLDDTNGQQLDLFDSNDPFAF